jgi:hypothetical protein
MKKILLTAFVVLIGLLAPWIVSAQQPIKATTFDGRKVLLYADGTWKASTADPGSAGHLGALEAPRTATLLSQCMHGDWLKAVFSFKFGLQDDPGLKLTHNQWDLLFDNCGGGFYVGMYQDSRSRLVDVGEMTWDALKEVPIVTVLPEGARSGSVPARQGHMYVLHTRNDSTDLYSIFRVDWLEPGDRCVISWVNVPSPEVGSSSAILELGKRP